MRCLTVLVLYVVWRVANFAAIPLGTAELLNIFLRGLATMTRVIVLIALASLIWTPIGDLCRTAPAS